MDISEDKFSSLKEYFNKADNISFSFLFGSRSKGLNRISSDYDIGIYFKPDNSRYIEIEGTKEYQSLDIIWTDLELVLKKEVDLVVLNNAPSHLASIIINQGVPILIKDEKLFSRFFLITTSNAIDYREFAREYYEIFKRSTSLSDADKTNLRKILTFIENEIKDYKVFKNLSWMDYQSDRNKRRNVERWIENLVNAVIDISKIFISSEKITLPETYRELILKLKLTKLLESESIDKLASWTKLRNILAHEYLDIRWTPIKNFIAESESTITALVNSAKEKVDEEEKN